MDNKKNQVIALGCRLNIFEAEVIKNNLSKTNSIHNTIVVNTCTVTQEAHRQSMQLIRKLKKDNPHSTIVVTGCGAQIDPQSYENMVEVDKIIGNADKLSVEVFLGKERVIVNDLNLESTNYFIPKIQGFENKTKAFIQIQQGCDHKCTFCIISSARGKSRSVLKEDIIDQIKMAVTFGHKEVVLTGVDISSWQRDALSSTPSRIGQLCMDILQEVPKLPRLRLSSLDPAVEDNNILKLLANEERFMPHLHLSLQSMNNNVLKNMGRRHTKEGAIEWINKLKTANSNIVLGADIIAGFPRESEEQHLETYEILDNLKIPFLHVFPYSQRSGTIAAKMKNIPVEVRKKRAKELIALGNKHKNNLLNSKINSIVEVLVENNNVGYTRDFCLAKILNNNKYRKEIVSTKVLAVENNKLLVELI